MARFWTWKMPEWRRHWKWNSWWRGSPSRSDFPKWAVLSTWSGALHLMLRHCWFAANHFLLGPTYGWAWSKSWNAVWTNGQTSKVLSEVLTDLKIAINKQCNNHSDINIWQSRYPKVSQGVLVFFTFHCHIHGCFKPIAFKSRWSILGEEGEADADQGAEDDGEGGGFFKAMSS